MDKKYNKYTVINNDYSLSREEIRQLDYDILQSSLYQKYFKIK